MIWFDLIWYVWIGLILFDMFDLIWFDLTHVRSPVSSLNIFQGQCPSILQTNNWRFVRVIFSSFMFVFLFVCLLIVQQPYHCEWCRGERCWWWRGHGSPILPLCPTLSKQPTMRIFKWQHHQRCVLHSSYNKFVSVFCFLPFSLFWFMKLGCGPKMLNCVCD